MTLQLRVDVSRSVLEDGANSHNRLWPDLEPVAVVEPGEELTLDIRDGMDGALSALADAEGLLTVDPSLGLPAHWLRGVGRRARWHALR